MAKYIDREDLYRFAKDHIEYKDTSMYIKGCNAMLRGIMSAARDEHAIPNADVVERKTGKWVKISPAGIYECNQCGQNVMTSDIEAYKFCHGCGAQMIGGDDDV